MLPSHHDLISSLHTTTSRWVLAITGGGTTAASDLLSVPGGSRTILEIVVPYHEQALAEFLGHAPDGSCGTSTSQDMARRAQERASWLTPSEHVFGLGSTASLISDQPKHGDHRVHVSIAGDGKIRTWSLPLNKGARSRLEEESIVSGLILHAMAQTLGLSTTDVVRLLPGEKINETAGPLDTCSPILDKTGILYVGLDGQLLPDIIWSREEPVVLVPGAFNPLHSGHRKLATVAPILEGKSAAFELSITNVDKPELRPDEVRRRLAQFVDHAPVWLTRAPLFTDKARLFPSATFAIGADTAQRLVDARYYANDENLLCQAFDFFRKQSCRFLVADRADANGHYLGLQDIAMPETFRDLFRPIPFDIFRMDVSSTSLRNRAP
jgi:hypothetical protein